MLTTAGVTSSSTSASGRCICAEMAGCACTGDGAGARTKASATNRPTKGAAYPDERSRLGVIDGRLLFVMLIQFRFMASPVDKWL